MSEIIRLLPDHIANQIAAGEVVQRPASVVKELMENAIDAGATRLNLYLKDAGKALIHLIDNGSGMGPRDARMAFERHATSKIREATDLFAIRTMGFRGEALASIAAVAQVHMKTRLHDDELGTEVMVEANEIKSHQPCITAAGTSLAVKNLFFNIPARRNFLKSNPVETRHILQEFTRVAMAHPEVSFTLEHNSAEMYNLPATTAQERVVQLMGPSLSGQLVPVQERTLYVQMQGFICKPAAARKGRGEQYFFVNDRFIKSGYLHHAVLNAYQDLIPDDAHPFYAIWLTIDPKHIDVNIHPTKTEIKFDDEATVYALLQSVVKKAVAALLPGPLEIDDEEGVAAAIRNTPPEQEPLTIGHLRTFPATKTSAEGWEKLFESKSQAAPASQASAQEPIPLAEPDEAVWLQFNERYLLSPTPDGLLILDMVHAHQRVRYEAVMRSTVLPPVASQQLLFPQSLRFTPEEMSLLKEMEQALSHIGFDLHPFGNEGYMLQGLPPDLTQIGAQAFFEELLALAREAPAQEVKNKIVERIALAVARRSSIQPGKKLNTREMAALYEQLLRCEHPGLSPSGKPTWFQVEHDFLDRHFRR